MICDFVYRANFSDIGVVVGGPTIAKCDKPALPNMLRCSTHVEKEALLLAYRWALAGKLDKDGDTSPDIQEVLQENDRLRGVIAQMQEERRRFACEMASRLKGFGE